MREIAGKSWILTKSQLGKAKSSIQRRKKNTAVEKSLERSRNVNSQTLYTNIVKKLFFLSHNTNNNIYEAIISRYYNTTD